MNEQISNPLINNQDQKLLKVLGGGIIIILALGGYLLIASHSKKESLKTEKQGKIEEPLVLSSPSPKEVIAPNQPHKERRVDLACVSDKEKIGVGESFNLKVVIDAKGEVVDGVEFVLNYDSNLLEIETPKEGSFFSLYPQKEVNVSQKTIRVMALQKPNENKPANQEVVIILPCKAKEKGVVYLNFDTSKTHISGYGGQELLDKITPLTLSIE